MASPSLLSVKKAVRSISTIEAEAVAQQALQSGSKEIIKMRLAELLGEEVSRVE
jgi:hypothetical protein